MVLLNDVVEAYNDYAEWVFRGKENEDLGDDLKETLVECLKDFFFIGDEVNESNVSFANANSGLGVQFNNYSITIEIPDSDEEDDYVLLTVRPDDY